MRSGLLVDYGGVLTTSVGRSFRAFCAEAGLDRDLVREVFIEAYDTPAGTGPVHLVETGSLTGDEFAAGLAKALTRRSGVTVDPDRLIDRLFASVHADERMLGAVAAVRAAGVRTGLLSNSWGRDSYPRDRFPALFDAVVISGEVGLRKPDPPIYRLAARRLGLDPADCVFVDDIDTNVAAAEAVGMAGVVHRSADATIFRLAELLGLPPAVLAGL